MTFLIAVLGLFGLSPNPVLISLALRYADHAPTLGSSLSVAAFNAGSAAASGIGGIAMGSVGPIAVEAVIAALTLVPTTALALMARRPQATAPESTSVSTLAGAPS